MKVFEIDVGAADRSAVDGSRRVVFNLRPYRFPRRVEGFGMFAQQRLSVGVSVCYLHVGHRSVYGVLSEYSFRPRRRGPFPFSREHYMMRGRTFHEFSDQTKGSGLFVWDATKIKES